MIRINGIRISLDEDESLLKRALTHAKKTTSIFPTPLTLC